jgi:hypothetical protein
MVHLLATGNTDRLTLFLGLPSVSGRLHDDRFLCDHRLDLAQRDLHRTFAFGQWVQRRLPMKELTIDAQHSFGGERIDHAGVAISCRNEGITG